MAAQNHATDTEQTSVTTDRYAVYDTADDKIGHTEDGAAITGTREEAADVVAAVADHMGISDDRLAVVRLEIIPLEPDGVDTGGGDGANAYTTGSIMVNRGPHRQHSQVVQYREAEDGAWAVKTPKDDEFWIFLRSGTERDVQQHIQAKWDATYSNPDSFTDRSCPTSDL